MKKRKFKLVRQTKETKVEVDLNLDVEVTDSCIATTIGFMDHMLTLFTMYAGIGLTIKATGDTCVDDHHLVEDIGITLGQTLKTSLGTKVGIMRYGFCLLPMDEALSYVALDLSGRFFLDYDVLTVQNELNSSFNYNLIYDFFYALADNAKVTLHIKTLKGRDNHHIIESIFKAFGLALKQAMAVSNVENTFILSTKGTLA
ncbi:MAG: imidazoleglycerol-phosphate dehydratase HisB [Endomicrobium sp.]|jgi:imidazoleglycerol-phosphate dehydratase|nr:imidazoleglycerol-phosphate dehydratase HisB [Endomicrobium sp.]